MKAFGFRPKLYTALKNYSKELFMADLMAGIIVGIVALPLAIAFGIASGVSPEQGTDWRTDRCVHRHYLWHHPAIR